MVQSARTTTPEEPAETPEQREHRLTYEARRIAEADASIAAGHVVTFEEVSAWVDSLGTPNELPLPRPR